MKPSPPHITIFLATCNGAENLEAQLASLAGQTHSQWSLLVSDDGSVDDTRRIVNNFASQGHIVKVIEGPRQGAAANFMSLLTRFNDHAPKDSWAAFCDQDDVWLPTKLERAITTIQTDEAAAPTLFCSRTLIVDDNLQGARLSADRPRPLGFKNALVQNVAAGNTIVLNSKGAQLLAAASHEAQEVVIHDWWAYQIISGAGGRLIHDDEPGLLYRQHAINQIGANDSKRAKIKRMAMLVSGTYTKWNRINIAAMKRSSHRFTDENQLLLDGFSKLYDLSLIPRVRGFSRLGLYRQTRASTLALWFALIIHRL